MYCDNKYVRKFCKIEDTYATTYNILHKQIYPTVRQSLNNDMYIYTDIHDITVFTILLY